MSLLELIHITSKDIIRLDQLRSLKFFEFLFRNVFNEYSLPLSALTLQSDPYIRDQGIDASILKDIPENYDFIPRGTSIFQFKASTSDFNLKKNFLQTSKKGTNAELKPLLKEFIENGATYVYIDTKKILTTDQKRAEEAKIIKFVKSYSDIANVKVKVYSADDVARWADKYPELRLKFNKIRNAIDFEQWKNRVKEKLRTDYLLTDNFKSLSLELLNNLRFDDSELKYFQVKGPPGVGKKTFIANTLELLDNFTKQNIIVIHSLEDEILNTLTKIIYSGLKHGILIFEGVTSNIFERIYSKLEWINQNAFKVIAIYKNYIYTQKKYEKTKVVDIKPLDEENAEKIILKLDPRIPLVIKKHILDLSSGIPSLILQLTSLLKDKKFRIYDETSIESFCEEILELLAKESGYEKPLLIQTLIAFSLFSELGWETATYQELSPDGFVTRFQGNKETLYELIGITHERYKVDLIVKYLLDKGILGMRGRYILVTIRPLANYILEKYVQENDIINYLKKIWELNIPHFMVKFLERMKDLAYNLGNKIVRQILDSDFISHWKDFQDPKSHMRDDELSKSQVFLELTRLDHKLAMEKLKKLFKNVEPIQLKQKLTNRRNLIYALEHIVWYQDTFKEGMNLLLKLAIGENEDYANNASGVFKDKFSVYLPGTSASLNRRMEYLTSLKNVENSTISSKILEVISQIFNLHHRFRIISAEIQSIRPIPEEYRKFTNEEYLSYLSSAFSLLKAYMNSSKPLIVERSYEILFEILPTLIGSDLWNDILQILRNYGKKNTENAVKLINRISSLKRREERFEIPKKVDAFYNLILDPSSIPDSNQFAKDLLEIIENERSKASYKSLNEEEKELYLKEVIKKKIQEARHFHDWDELIQEIEADLSTIDKIKISLTDREWFLEERGGMSFEKLQEHKAEEITSTILKKEDEFWDIIRFLINSDELLVSYIGKVLAKKDPTYSKWDRIKQIFIEEKKNRRISFLTGYFTDLRINRLDEWIAKLKELKEAEGPSRDLFLLGIATKKLDNWVIDLTEELIQKGLLTKSDLMRLVYRTDELDEKSFVRLAQIFFKFFDNPLEGFRSGRFDPEEFSDPLMFLHHYLTKHKSVIPQLKGLLLEILTHFEKINGRLKTLSRYWKDLVVMFVKECPDLLELILNNILDNLERFPLQFPDYDIEFVVLKFLEISQKTVLMALDHLFEKEYNEYSLIEFTFTHRLILRLPEDFIIKICRKDPEKIPPLFVKLLQELIRDSETLPRYAKLLLSNFPDNEYLHSELIFALASGIKVFLPGTEASYEAQVLNKLQKWKKEEDEDVIHKWIDKAIDYMKQRFDESKMRDEEALRRSVLETQERDIVFYEMQSWLNKMRGEYPDETIAFAKIGDEWMVLSHSKDENQVYQEINEKYKNGQLDKELNVRFKSFRDEK